MVQEKNSASLQIPFTEVAGMTFLGRESHMPTPNLILVIIGMKSLSSLIVHSWITHPSLEPKSVWPMELCEYVSLDMVLPKEEIWAKKSSWYPPMKWLVKFFFQQTFIDHKVLEI